MWMAVFGIWAMYRNAVTGEKGFETWAEHTVLWDTSVQDQSEWGEAVYSKRPGSVSQKVMCPNAEADADAQVLEFVDLVRGDG